VGGLHTDGEEAMSLFRLLKCTIFPRIGPPIRVGDKWEWRRTDNNNPFEGRRFVTVTGYQDGYVRYDMQVFKGETMQEGSFRYCYLPPSD
jgi:hypothetical protein